MKFYKIVGICLLAMVVVSCASSKMSALPINTVSTHPVRAIAMAPEGGLLAEAVGIELSNLGYTLIDSATTSRLLVRLNMDEIEVSTPQGLMKLKDKGIDAFLTVKTAGAYDGQVQNASARASSTHNGKIIAGVSWQNGWGGMAGSIADRTMRKGLTEVAQEIAASLSRSLPMQ
jgi:hypothetical protein